MAAAGKLEGIQACVFDAYGTLFNVASPVEKLAGEPGDVVTFDQVLVVGNGDDVTVGAPLVAGATVAAHFLGTKKARTVIIQKKHRRQHPGANPLAHHRPAPAGAGPGRQQPHHLRGKSA